MKITFVLWGTKRTGGTNAIFQVGDRLAKMGHNVTFVSAGPIEHQWFKFTSNVDFLFPEAKIFPTFVIRKKKVLLSEIISYFLKVFGRGLDLSRHIILASSIPSDSDCVVATFFETAFSVQMADIPDSKKFYYIQHYELVFFEDQISKRRVKQTYYFPFKWIVSSTWANKMLMENIGRSGSIVIPGIDVSTFNADGPESTSDKFKIIALGKSAKVKGIKCLFEALSIARGSIPNIQLILYGTEPELRTQSPVDTEYIVRPSNEELSKLYASADVLVTPSLYESSPSPPLEAMACGTPVITTRFGTEDYCYDNENSLVVLPEDANALSEAIIRLHDNPDLRDKLRRNGLKTVASMTWDRTAEEFNKVILGNTNNDT